MSSSGHHESVPCVVVNFELHRGNQIDYYKVDCVSVYLIEGLKEDNAGLFQIDPKKQVWTHLGVVLENSKLLADYFDVKDEIAQTIVVKNSDEL